MPRWAAEYRRSIRLRLSHWIGVLLGIFSAAGLILFVVHHNQLEDRNHQTILDKGSSIEQVSHDFLNYTDDISSAASISRQLADEMTLAKAYLVIAKEHNNLLLAWELSSNIRCCQLLLSKAAMREESITLYEAEPIIKTLSYLIYKAQDAHFDIATTMMTMKSHIEALEERVNTATIQSMIFGQLMAEALPKSLHCLSVKLTANWIKESSTQELGNERRNLGSPRFINNNLYHFCIFSDNLLAVSVVINSTVFNADHPKHLVFHVLTNGVSSGAMHAWFLGNDFKGASIEVQTTEELSCLNAFNSHVVNQVLQDDSQNHPSLLEHLRFYIPEVYPQLEKVVFLDDDVVVQKDLTPLFSLDLHRDVNGAAETCLEAFHRYYKYLNFSSPIINLRIDPRACGWAFGVNVFDLVKWKRANTTALYHYWQDQIVDHALWRTGTLPPSLLVFYGMTEVLDRRWHVLGLSYNMKIDKHLIANAAVLHFSGHLKPWLRLGIGRYRPLWERYMNQAHPYHQDCAPR